MTTSLTSASIIHHWGARWFGALRRSAYLVAAALIAAAMAASAGNSAASGHPAAQLPMVGVHTGELVNGAPVYRFSPINVVGHREAEMAKMKRDEQHARVKPARARPAAQPQARSADAATMAPGTRVN